ncbi:MAG: hypothetical protein ABW167_19490 [Baekduia sp.]
MEGSTASPTSKTVVGGAPDPDAVSADGPPQEGMTEEELKAFVQAKRDRREAREVEDDDEPRTGSRLLRAAQGVNSGKDELSEKEIVGALDYFLATEQDAEVTVEPTELKLNVGTKGERKLIRWVIAPVEDTRITAIRKESVKGTRAQRRSGQAEVDETLVSRKLVVEGTVDPDPRELARTMGLSDTADAIHAFFKRFGKTGLITQISGEILSVSGWDDEDLQEVEAARG